MTEVWQGQSIKLRFTIINEINQLYDPSDVLMNIRINSSSRIFATYGYIAGDFIRESQGIYHVFLNPNLPGIWEYTVHNTGAFVGIYKSQFTVKRL